jgi:hypothetical protein
MFFRVVNKLSIPVEARHYRSESPGHESAIPFVSTSQVRATQATFRYSKRSDSIGSSLDAFAAG